MPPRKIKAAPKVLLKATKKAVDTMNMMQKNLYYTDKFRQKEKDYNAKLQLWKNDSLNKNIKK